MGNNARPRSDLPSSEDRRRVAPAHSLSAGTAGGEEATGVRNGGAGGVPSSASTVDGAAALVAPITMSDVEVAAEHDATEKLRLWFKARGVAFHPHVQVQLCPPAASLGDHRPSALSGFPGDLGRGLFVRQHPAGLVTQGATILSVPHSAYWSPADVDSSVASSPVVDAIHAAFPAATHKLPTLSRMCLRYMSETARGRRESSWWPWLRLVPPVTTDVLRLQPDTEPARWCPGVNEELASLDLHGKWDAVRCFVTGGADPAASTAAFFPAPHNTFQAFVASAAAILSRNFHIEARKEDDGPFLVPGIDFINHVDREEESNVRLTLRGGGGLKGVTFDVVATRPLHAGEEVRFCYGPLNAARFMTEFQFLPSVMPASCVRFSQRQLAQWAVAQQRQLRVVDASDARRGPNAVVEAGAEGRAMVARVNAMDRVGLIFQEGVLVGRGQTSRTSDDKDTPSPLAAALGVDGRLLVNAVALLTMADAQWDSMEHHLARWWNAPVTPALRDRVESLLLWRRDLTAQGTERLKSWQLSVADGGDGAPVGAAQQVGPPPSPPPLPPPPSDPLPPPSAGSGASSSQAVEGGGSTSRAARQRADQVRMLISVNEVERQLLDQMLASVGLLRV